MLGWALLCILNWSLLASAGGLAGAYERVFLWYAYNIERLFTGGGETRDIAWACPAPCDFRTFLTHIDGWPANNFPFSINPNERFPDVHTTAQTLLAENWVPDKFGAPRRIVRIANGVVTTSKALSVVTNIIAQMDLETHDRFPNAFINAHLAAESSRDLRAIDFSDYSASALRSGSGCKIIKSGTATQNYGRAIDWEATSVDPDNLAEWGSEDAIDRRLAIGLAKVLRDNQDARGHWHMLVTMHDSVAVQKGGLCRISPPGS